MGIFEEIGKRIDKGFAGIGRGIASIGRKITGVGERIEKKFAPEVVVRKKTWRDRTAEAIDEEIEAGMTDEEVREKYDRENGN
jgi:citrate synthase